ncbi:MAG TPA: DUF6065 family protein [Rhodanobacteraceae bacterium]|jgi:hypothetical protein|nr:DUF6065 family protein [Rhodanobacteraceae bacterium]
MAETEAQPAAEAAARGAPTQATASPDPTPRLTCYRVDPRAVPIVPGRRERAWMDQTADHYAYRCLPLSMANASGWELASPFAFEVTWDGNQAIEGITARAQGLDPEVLRAFITSHFGHGILTFHTGWLFRTSPGWGLWVRGAPNYAKDGIHPLDGMVETDWLPFPFTMNWRFTRPCTVRFGTGDPFCFITLCPHALLDDITPTRADIEDDPGLKADYAEWAASRAEFNKLLHDGDPATVARKWQRGYFQGKGTGGEAPFHVSKRRLKPLK